MITLIVLLAASHAVCKVDEWHRAATHVRRIRDREIARLVDRQLRDEIRGESNPSSDAGPGPRPARRRRTRGAS